ncbi:T9SS type A sorting domain-containing protein [Dyadobacter sp. CY347]|uniref:T9SS type A sorting domain-containing protein n=1 Tax=Dyadobacter sp. CY347 TaxID=2909336 RepID=UPI001F42C339|nr:T9SS type A sorting domain-containing protein [Dyadobacter sp. CY347]MCF2487102.1 T9SS type A sorting domain-containing protein [Dyadobacter sp. CY347]
MKKIFTLCICFVVVLSVAQAKTCGVGGITFGTQASIDNFNANNPGCTQVLGPVTISGPDIVNLNGLAAIVTIAGDLTIQNNPLLTSLNGLGSLTDILPGDYIGQLIIQNNPGLTNLTGLGALQNINHNFSVRQCDALTSLSGLTALETIGEGVSIDGCPLLKNLNGLEAITSLKSMSIGSNAGLTSLGGLESLNFLGFFQDFKGISNYNALSSITALPYGFEVVYSNGFTGLENVTSIGGPCTFSFCNSLNGLPALKTISGTLYIVDCQISNLNAFYALESIGGLDLENNENLSQCNIQSICKLLADSPGDAIIGNNASGCTAPEISSSMTCEGIVAETDIVNFEGVKVLTTIELTWQTSSETDVLGFAVERSTTPNAFVQIGYVFTEGDSPNPQSYSFNDYMSNLQNYYRLKEEKVNGDFSYSDIIYVEGNVPTCPVGGVVFSTQASIDQFSTNYPACTSIVGDVYIGGSTITNLNGLASVTSIAGTLRIANSPALSNFSGLDALTSVTFSGDPQDPFNVSGNIVLNQLPLITSLDGLGALTTIAGRLDISYLQNLTSLAGVENLTTIGIGLSVTATKLVDLTGMKNLQTFQFLGFSENSLLTSFNGLPPVTNFSLSLSANPNLIDFTGLEFVTNLTRLEIAGVGPSSFTGLSSIESIEQIRLTNTNFTSLVGIENIDPAEITSLYLRNSALLSACNVKSLCIYLADPNNAATISNNGVECSTRQEIISSETCIAILPVHLISFEGKSDAKGNVLTWKTASETKNKGFEIERSTNPTSFQKIGFVEGNGDANEENNYSFTDPNPGTITYYRLKQIDFDGTFEHSKIIALRNGQGTAKVYPNPSRGTLHIESKDKNQPYSIRNVQGFSVIESSVLPSKPLDMSSLQNGLYLITVGKEVFKVAVQN